MLAGLTREEPVSPAWNALRRNFITADFIAAFLVDVLHPPTQVLYTTTCKKTQLNTHMHPGERVLGASRDTLVRKSCAAHHI